MKRIFGLDILRAIAILSVLVGHSAIYLPKTLANIIYHINPDGVSIFFVLSGFLIGGILIKVLENNKPTMNVLLDFWYRRWLRTVPPYFFVLILLMVFNAHSLYGYMLEYFAFAQNIVKPHPSFFPEAWSLSVEEWFYLSIPTMLFLLCRVKISPKISVVICAAFIIIVCTALRVIKYNLLGVPDYHALDGNFRKIVVLRLDAIVYGLIGAFVAYYYKAFWYKARYILFGVGVVILIVYQLTLNIGQSHLSTYDTVFAFSLTSIGALFLLPLMSTVKTGSGILATVITTTALVSYSAYLLNLSFIMDIVIVGLKQPAYVNYGLFWVLTTGLSILMYNFIEVPCMGLRKRLK